MTYSIVLTLVVFVLVYASMNARVKQIARARNRGTRRSHLLFQKLSKILWRLQAESISDSWHSPSS